jgi:SAM-dependent methyltransferase
MEEAAYDAIAKSERTHWWYSARREILEWACGRALLGAPKDGLLYDLGCGVGANLPMLSRFGEVVGVDGSEQAVAYCRARGSEVRRGDLDRLSEVLAAGTARLVLLADVIEHLDDDRACIDDVHRLLLPGGALVVTVPAFRALWSVNDDVSRHKRRYTASMLRRVLEGPMRIEHMTYFNSLLAGPIALGRVAERFVRARPTVEQELPPRLVNDVLRGVFASELRWLRRGRRFPVGVSLLAICRRR